LSGTPQWGDLTEPKLLVTKAARQLLSRLVRVIERATNPLVHPLRRF
jgi:hypothetical protein